MFEFLSTCVLHCVIGFNFCFLSCVGLCFSAIVRGPFPSAFVENMCDLFLSTNSIKVLFFLCEDFAALLCAAKKEIIGET